MLSTLFLKLLNVEINPITLQYELKHGIIEKYELHL